MCKIIIIIILGFLWCINANELTTIDENNCGCVIFDNNFNNLMKTNPISSMIYRTFIIWVFNTKHWL